MTTETQSVNDNNRITVIVAADDTPERRDIVRSLLASRYTVKSAVNGPMTLKIASNRPPDLILLDTPMSGLGGHEVCRQLKPDPATADIPVIFVAGESDVGSKIVEAGGDDDVTKPVDRRLLLPTIEKHLAGTD